MQNFRPAPILIIEPLPWQAIAHYINFLDEMTMISQSREKYDIEIIYCQEAESEEEEKCIINVRWEGEDYVVETWHDDYIMLKNRKNKKLKIVSKFEQRYINIINSTICPYNIIVQEIKSLGWERKDFPQGG